VLNSVKNQTVQINLGSETKLFFRTIILNSLLMYQLSACLCNCTALSCRFQFKPVIETI